MDNDIQLKTGVNMNSIQLKTMEYLDLHEVLKTVEKTTLRTGLSSRVWESLINRRLFDGNDSFGYVPIEKSHEDLITDYGQQLGNDFEVIKQAVAHIPIKKMRWFSQ